MKKFLILLLSLFISLSANAQDKQLTMEDAVINQYTTLAPKRLNAHWIGYSDQYYYTAKKGNGYALFTGSASAPGQEAKVLLSLSEINASLKKMGKDTLSVFPSLEWNDPGRFEFEQDQNVYRYSVTEKSLNLIDSLELPENASDRDEAPETGAIAFTVENNLYILADDKVKTVSEHENKAVVSGQAVSRFEFGISKGTFWSPDGKKLAFYVKDESEVMDYPIIDWTQRPAVAKNIKYPMAGSESERLQVKVYDLESGKTTVLQTGEPAEQYLTNITWSPDSRMVYIAHLNRDQNHMELKRYHALNGKMDQKLFEERSEKYVEPLQPVHFVPNHPDLFVLESSRTGYNHLYLYNTDGKLLRSLTKGTWTVTAFEGFDKAGEKAFYTSTETSPLNRDLYSVSLKGKIKRLTEGKGNHQVSISEAGTYFIDDHSSTAIPLRTTLRSARGEELRELSDAEDPLKDYALGDMRIFTIKDKKGGDLYGRMYLPPNFDSTQKYPVVVYLYGGPHVQLIRNSWLGGGNLWFPYMAQQGYIVWTLDNRGSGGRGKKWEQETFRQLGAAEMEDQMQGVHFLKSKSYVDTTRLGIHGWSFGGFMTISLMTRHPGTFKVAVAGGPVIDWSYYEVMYTERYMDTPGQNPEGYKTNNLLNYVQDLDGKLLIIHGTSDDIVVWQHTQMYLEKAVEEGIQVDYFVYPMHGHNVRGKDRVHLMEKITGYFEDFL